MLTQVKISRPGQTSTRPTAKAERATPATGRKTEFLNHKHVQQVIVIVITSFHLTDLRQTLGMENIYIFPHGRTFQTQSQFSPTVHGGQNVS